MRLGVEYEKHRAQYGTLGNAIMERSMLRLQTIYGDCMFSVTKIRRKPRQSRSRNAKRVLKSFKENLVIYCIEGC